MAFRFGWMAALGAPFAAFSGEAAWSEPLLRAVSSSYRQALAAQARLRDELAVLPETPHNQQSSRLGYQIHRGSNNPMSSPAWVEVELPAESEIDAVVLVPVDAPSRDFSGPGYGFPQRFRVDLIGNDAEHTLAEYTTLPFANPGGLPVWLPAHGHRGQRVRLTMTEPWTRVTPFAVYALGEIMVIRGNRNLAAGAPVSSSEPAESLMVWGRPDYLTDSQSVLGAPLGREPSRTLGYHSAIVETSDVVKWVQVDLGAPMPVDEVRMLGGYVVHFPSRPGFGFPVRFKIEAANEPEFTNPILLVDHTAQDFPNPANNPVTFPGRHTTARYVRVTATKLWERVENFAFALAELQIYSGDRNVALGRPVQTLDRFASTTRAWMPEHLTDGFASEHRLTEWPDWLRGLSRRREAMIELNQAERAVAETRLTAVTLLTRAGLALGFAVVAGSFVVVRQARRARRRELERLRERIAADLHDEIGSNLGSIALLGEMGAQRASGIVRTDLEEIRRVARQTADSMRDIVGLIQRPAGTGEEFAGKLREVAARMLAGLDWTFASSPRLELPSLTAQRHLLLAFKETLHNVRKHARARHVSIRLTWQERRLRFEIADDGVGFTPSAATAGHGLENLRQRAAALGGAASITSSPGAGTTVLFSIDPFTARNVHE